MRISDRHTVLSVVMLTVVSFLGTGCTKKTPAASNSGDQVEVKSLLQEIRDGIQNLTQNQAKQSKDCPTCCCTTPPPVQVAVKKEGCDATPPAKKRHRNVVRKDTTSPPPQGDTYITNNTYQVQPQPQPAPVEQRERVVYVMPAMPQQPAPQTVYVAPTQEFIPSIPPAYYQEQRNLNLQLNLRGGGGRGGFIPQRQQQYRMPPRQPYNPGRPPMQQNPTKSSGFPGGGSMPGAPTSSPIRITPPGQTPPPGRGQTGRY